VNLLLLAYIPFLHAWPWALPERARLWLFLPLALSVAVVYRATRVRRARELPWPTLVTFVQIVIGMGLIALGFLLAYELAIRYLA
jgi:hypothetical protein